MAPPRYNARSMDSETIQQKLRLFLGDDDISAEQVGSISTYLDLLQKWNSRINLTAIRSDEEIVTRHFGESLFAARQLRYRASSASSLIDLGSGAGFPGIPIKIWIPELQVRLVESRQKKAAFLNEVVRALKLPGTEVMNRRAELVFDRADFVTLRAVEKFGNILPVAAKLLKPEGKLVLLIGDQQISEASSLLPTFSWQGQAQVPLSSSRIVLIGQNIA